MLVISEGAVLKHFHRLESIYCFCVHSTFLKLFYFMRNKFGGNDVLSVKMYGTFKFFRSPLFSNP